MYDDDKHGVGSYIALDMEHAKERKIPQATSEAMDLKGGQEVERGRARKRTRNETEWNIVVQHKKQVRGESYSPAARKGESPKQKRKASKRQRFRKKKRQRAKDTARDSKGERTNGLETSKVAIKEG